MRASLFVFLSIVALGCGNNSDASSTSSGDSGDGADASDATPPPNDGSDAGVDAVGEGGILDGGTATPTEITLTGVPAALAANDTTKRVYVSMSEPVDGGLGKGAGFAVIDGTTNTLIASIPPPAPATTAGAAVFGALAVDETANRIYVGARANDVGRIHVIDGATNALTTIPAPSTTVYGVEALAVDAAAHRLYAWLDGTSPTYAIGVWDTTTNAFLTSIPIGDMAGGSNDELALDPTNHLLFVCGYPSLTSAGAGYDTIDTTSDAIKGAQVTYDSSTDGYFVGCTGGPGFGTLVTNGTTSSPAVLEELEPLRYTLPAGLRVVNYFTYAGIGRHTVRVFGQDEKDNWKFLNLSVKDEKVEEQFSFYTNINKEAVFNGEQTDITLDSNQRVYLTFQEIGSSTVAQGVLVVDLITPPGIPGL